MSDGYRFDRSSLSGAGHGLLDAAADFERHTGGLLATVRGTGDTAWGGTSVGVAMDRLGDLLDEACRVLHGNLHRTGDGVRSMADDLRLTEADAVATVNAAGPGIPGPGAPGTPGSARQV
ncbi:hypothetical protein ACWGH8_42705 [Nonomuraea muscovyensis]|uniref:Excreted virulence factor EspC, type VII ESX diderm n=1 Tax=Nonomuraea muscovyensis TaxID=1124761 RepID=A0A7X0C556_9ACTN|nr:hypothetical protein [Nonomuraea muscovyensis]MBB6348323.1 hypothetical protein [Nonomuraea muscovyensis]